MPGALPSAQGLVWGVMSSELLGGARRVLFVHAHPDDETLATGGLIVGFVLMMLMDTLLG